MGLNVPFGVPVELLDEERDGVRAPELAAGDGDAPLGESIRYAVVARQGGSTEPQSKNRDIDGGKLPFKQQCRTAVARPKAYHGVPCRGETRPGVRVGDPCVVPEGGRGRGTDLCARRARAEARTRTLSYAYVQVRHDR